ncbi:tryptophan--tRNA ligase [Candidatus Haliotispira prima]|uniref:Tryptophan--tRNA ligase n=1 Tax=Candidatus Haliotispira prima TaxID=3034016 RepID=A0ABY8ME36_9SPIO|nr:tryptophan--tRNA ligase [Candidatus Haliotispira prima]
MNKDPRPVANDTYAAAVAESQALEQDLRDPENRRHYRMLTGDRPTGRLHIGHYFGSLQNRVALQQLGLETFIVIADYQVLTDRDRGERIAYFTRQLCMDYLAVGLDPENHPVHIFVHSQVPELNQLFVPFLTLVSQSELERNPTTKDELQHSSLGQLSASLLAYPVHQAADILFCHGNVVPVGKDQLPHIELTRNIARRFNKRYSDKQPYFPRPIGLLSRTPSIMGLDGTTKMSKSRGNSIELSAGPEEVAKSIKQAKTDSERRITYEPERRPEVANLLQLLGLCSGENPEDIAESIGDGGSGALKRLLTEQLNAVLEPIQRRRKEFEQNEDYIDRILARGCAVARERAAQTMKDVHRFLGTYIV